ncbi:S41 family peptidase [Thermophagus xiamenensis]|uniref:C-terminal processing peptidase-3. Serine peptidase. MEROPS family S41A n=1 Tax=Thermophagus xiamenensis TaxID=385682 RepID=A0A1I2D317_9BACT|nr:S41 family peptidase [Thermophagus xiamenensis]SFE74370.1 C-terminal processing peptidase-3. Serine peptidase. MEROPS family S41A [Thermophagus xiamenensis]
MKKLKTKKWLNWTSGILFVLILSLGFVSANNEERNFSIVKNLDIFYSLFRELNTYYVDKTDPGELIETAINAMLESLDPYTTFIPEKEMEDFNFMTTGEYAGIGALITRVDDYVYISEPYKGFPADKAGLKAGDKIIAIDGVEMKGKSTEDVSNKLKGPANTEVKVTIERYGSEKPIEITIVRKNIQINPVPYYGLVEDNTGLIILNNFTHNCSEVVEQALEDLKKQGAEKIILDLRGNPGGLLDEAVKVVNLFVPRGSEVVSTKGKIKQWDKVYRATKAPVDTVIPLAIMINRGSASASEIVAGAIQDLDRGVIVGSRSFGKGLVQTTRNLPYNTKLKVTTAKYYIPSGRCIQALDYSHRNEDGSVGYVPDSLVSEFQTLNGRTVYDGGGISPDIVVPRDTFSNIAYALVAQQTIFKYANVFCAEHKSIPEPEEFAVSDEMYNHFTGFVLSLDDFKYTSASRERFKKLVEAAKSEGYYDLNKEEFEALEEKLNVDVSFDLKNFRDEVEDLLANELLKRFYYQEGAIKYALKDDKVLKKTIEVINDEGYYRGILNGTVLSHAGDRLRR